MSVRETGRVSREMTEVVELLRPMSESAYEIEINLYEIARAALAYVTHRDQRDLGLLYNNRADLRRALDAFTQLAAQSAGRDDDGQAARLDTLTREFDAAVLQLVASAATLPRADLGDSARRAMDRLNALQRRLDAVLDNTVQPHAVTQLHAAAADIRRSATVARWTIVLLAPLALAVGVGAFWMTLGSYQSAKNALRTAERVSEQKTELASITAHELRSPLTAMLGSLRVMRSGKAGEIPPSALPYIDMASRNSTRLLNLINDLLDLDRIEAGRAPFKQDPVSVSELARVSTESLAGMAEERAVRMNLRADSTRRVRGDFDRLQQVLVNLLSNAMKHSPRNERVDLVTEDRGAYVRFTVRDHGEGIAAEDVERIFQRFAQTGSANQAGNTGLGLAIAREIVHRHEGRIGVDSTKGDGARFWFEIPAV